MGSQPRPFLDSEEVHDRLKILGFEFEKEDDRYPIDNPAGRLKFSALMELIAGGIAEWADVEEEPGTTTFEQINNELNDFAQEFLIG